MRGDCGLIVLHTEGVLVKTTLVDYPGKVASAFFMRGCNLRCPYCYNTQLVTGKTDAAETSTSDEVIAHLKKRKAVLTGFVLSGGEPLMSPGTAELVSVARGLGYSIKLDTNGTFPDLLEKIIASPETKPDYIALDVKTSPQRYGILSPGKDSRAEIMRSIKIVAALPPEMREYRTVLVPNLIAEADILAIANLLPKDAAWFFAPFKPGNCLDPAYNAVKPYTDAQISRLTDAARAIIPGAQLR
jgi:pyruvate formate lyase activating enzyme